MDIARMSMTMNNAALKSAVQLSVMKLQMNTSSDMAKGMTDMLKSAAVDPNLGRFLDTKA